MHAHSHVYTYAHIHTQASTHACTGSMSYLGLRKKDGQILNKPSSFYLISALRDQEMCFSEGEDRSDYGRELGRKQPREGVINKSKETEHTMPLKWENGTKSPKDCVMTEVHQQESSSVGDRDLSYSRLQGWANLALLMSHVFT